MIYIFNKDLGEIMDILVKRGGIAAYETLVSIEDTIIKTMLMLNLTFCFSG